MNFVIAALIILPIIMLALSVVLAVKKQSKGASGKKAFKTHLAVVGALVVMMTMLTIGASAAGANDDKAPVDNGTAVTQSAGEAETASNSGLEKGLGYIAAALSIGLAGIGAGLSIAAGAPAAIGATSENPKMFGKGMIFCVLGEAIAIYGLVISFMILLV